MASFRTHVTVGLIVGYAAGAFVVVSQWMIAQFTPLAMFAAAFIGSFLPDLDSDHGKPFNIIFSMLAATGGSLAFYYFLDSQRLPWTHWVVIPPLVALLIRYGVGEIFQRLTRHRGIFHSIPAVLIATLVTPVVLQGFALPNRDVIAISLSVGLGFLSHLILDEIYSTVNFEGIKFAPKKSLGTALAFTAPSIPVTIGAYVLLGVLIVLNWPLIQQLGSYKDLF